MKSGKPSWLGDSGMVSRKGVEPPLAGGPHMLGVKPSCAWISRALEMTPSLSDALSNSTPFFTYLFEYSRPPSSCDGEPAPNRVLLAALIPFTGLGFPNGDRTALPAGASIGEVVAVDDPDRGWEAEN